MSEQTKTRRNVLKACGAACLGTTAATASADEATAKPNSESVESTDLAGRDGRSGTYRGTVTHILGDNVLVLVDGGYQPDRQFVFDRDELPAVEEGDSLSLWLWRGRVVHVW